MDKLMNAVNYKGFNNWYLPACFVNDCAGSNTDGNELLHLAYAEAISCDSFGLFTDDISRACSMGEEGMTDACLNCFRG